MGVGVGLGVAVGVGVGLGVAVGVGVGLALGVGVGPAEVRTYPSSVFDVYPQRTSWASAIASAGTVSQSRSPGCHQRWSATRPGAGLDST